MRCGREEDCRDDCRDEQDGGQGAEMLKEVLRRRSAVAQLRKVVRNGELVRNREHMARLRFEEKVKRLATIPAE